MAENHTLDVLAFGAHPDDVELCCGGTILSMVANGYKVGLVDLTEGELSSRGTVASRRIETKNASEILGISVRENLGIADGNINNSELNRQKIIDVIRKYRPEIVLVNPKVDRHPDHGHAAKLVVESAYYAGLRMIESDEGYEAWRPKHVLHYMQSVFFEPDIIMDVSDHWSKRVEATLAYKTQFNISENQDGNEPATYISSPAYLEWIEARAKVLGYRVGAQFGEGFLYSAGAIGTDDLVDLLKKQPRR